MNHLLKLLVKLRQFLKKFIAEPATASLKAPLPVRIRMWGRYQMNITESRREGNLIVAPDGRIDSLTSSTFDRHLSSVIDRGDANLIIDLTNLEYISSTGLSAFLSAAKKIKVAGGRMALVGLNSRIRLVFEMSGFLRLFPIYPTVDAALGN